MLGSPKYFGVNFSPRQKTKKPPSFHWRAYQAPEAGLPKLLWGKLLAQPKNKKALQ